MRLLVIIMDTRAFYQIFNTAYSPITAMVDVCGPDVAMISSAALVVKIEELDISPTVGVGVTTM